MNELLIALIGAIVGGILSLIGSVVGVRLAAQETQRQEMERLQREAQERQNSIMRNLLAEVKDNVALSERIQIAYAKIRYIHDVWDAVRGDICFLSTELQDQLRKVYAEINRYNVLADYEQAKVPFGEGSLDADLGNQDNAVRELLLPLAESLEQSSLSIARSVAQNHSLQNQLTVQ